MSSTTDRAEIEALLHRLSDAWNAGDADAYGALFTDDASYVDVMGTLSRGRERIVALHRWLFAKIPGSRMAEGAKTDREISFLGPDVALVLGSGAGTTAPGQESGDQRASTVSFVVLRGPAGWRFTHFQNTRVTPLPAALSTSD